MKWRQPADPRVVEAVIAAFRPPSDGLYALLLPLSAHQWKRSFYWLDASGMALYLLDRLQRLDLARTLPPSVRTRLQQNRSDNRTRSQTMFDEFLELNIAFQAAGVDYCNLKGFTLFPESCPDPSLRCQLDFDFLVDGHHLALCCDLLAKRGYVLHASTQSVYEFKTGAGELARIEDFYKPRPQRSVEIHFSFDPSASHRPTRDPRLDRLEWSRRGSVLCPALSPVDQFVGQAGHLFQHLCGTSTRIAWLLEFMAHMNVRIDDQMFWNAVRDRLAGDPEADRAVAVSCLLVSDLFDGDLPSVIETGAIARLPQDIRLWVQRYGRQALLADFPGTKLGLLLREQLRANDTQWKQERRRLLVPLHRAPRIVPIGAPSSIHKKVLNQIYQARYDLFRLRFHIVEGLRYVVEASRWHRALKLTRNAPHLEAAHRSQTTAKSL